MGQCCHGVQQQQDAAKDASAGQGPSTPSSERHHHHHNHFDSHSDLDSTRSSSSSSEEEDLVPRGKSFNKSPGKYSLRESKAGRVDSDDDDESTEEASPGPGRDSLTPLREVQGSRASRGSSGSERRSVSPAGATKRGLRATLGRSLSLKLQRTTPRADALHSTSWVGSAGPPKQPLQQQQQSQPQQQQQQHQRSVSLRLPRKPRRPRRNLSAKLPTIYVDGAEVPDGRREQQELTRKISLNHALSLLSVNSFAAKQEAPKPVQRILRQPQRRHNTVRGLSGMAIGASNQASLHRYYPTSTGRRQLPRSTSALEY